MAYCDDCGLTVCYEMGGSCRTYPNGKPPPERIRIILDEETGPLLDCIKRTAEEVAKWPAWKRGG